MSTAPAGKVLRKSLAFLAVAALCASCGGGSGGASGTGGNATGSGGASTGTGGAATATGGTSASGGTTGTGGSGGSLPGSGGQGGVAGAQGGNGGRATGGRGGSAGNGSGGGSATGGHGGGGPGGQGGTAGSAAASGGSSGAGGHAGATGTGGSAGAAGFQPCPAAATTACAILPLGDSITEGWLPTGGVGGYRVELFNQAVMAGKNITFVGSLVSNSAPSTVANKPFPKHHEGHDGYTIDNSTGSSGIGGAITDQALADDHPNIVLLMIGTNDVNGNLDVANAPTRLGKLIDEITSGAPSALVVVASIIPIASGNNSKAMAYNAAIPGLVNTRAAAGKHVIFVDNYAAFIKDANYQTTEMSNYLHPNGAGYAVLGRSFYGAIAAYLP